MFRIFKWLIIIGLLIGLYFYYPNILKAIGNYLVENDSLEKSDAILVLGGDDEKGNRVSKGAKLYKEGYGKYLILSGREIRWNTFETDIMEKQASHLKVPKLAIINAKNKASSTLAEAKFLKQLFEKRHFKSIIIVTSNYHTKRAKWVFSKVLKGTNIKISVHPSENSNYNPSSWWKDRNSTKTLFYEYTKLLWYTVVERFNLKEEEKQEKNNKKPFTQQVLLLPSQPRHHGGYGFELS